MTEECGEPGTAISPVAVPVTPETKEESQSTLQRVRVSEIIEDPAIQSRVKLNQGVVKEYAAAMNAGIQFPPIEVFNIRGRFYVVDGFHRLQATRKVGFEDILVSIHEGTFRDAVVFSAGMNSEHGLQRTSADKRRAVINLLNDEEWSRRSNVAIANACNVGERLVRSVRGKLSSPGAMMPQEVTVQRGGKEYTLNIKNIRKSRVKSPDPVAKVDDQDVHADNSGEHQPQEVITKDEQKPTPLVEDVPKPALVEQLPIPVEIEPVPHQSESSPSSLNAVIPIDQFTTLSEIFQLVLDTHFSFTDEEKNKLAEIFVKVFRQEDVPHFEKLIQEKICENYLDGVQKFLDVKLRWRDICLEPLVKRYLK